MRWSRRSLLALFATLALLSVMAPLASLQAQSNTVTLSVAVPPFGRQALSDKVIDGLVTLRDGSLAIGSNYPQSRPVAPAMMWGVDVRNHASSAGEVARQYQSVVGSQGAQGTQPGRAPGH